MTTMSIEELQNTISADNMKPLKSNDGTQSINKDKKKSAEKDGKKRAKK